MDPIIRLDDPSLFGNDAAEDEDQGVFDSYVVERPELKDFIEPSQRIKIARAYKGEGKSALLRLACRRIESENSSSIVVKTTASAIAPTLSEATPEAWVTGWKKSILKLVANEVGTRIGMAWTDDTMSLVEEAEKNGFRKRSLVSSVLDRLKIKDSPIPTREVLGVSDAEQVLKRWKSGRPDIWVVIDDVDQNFQNTAAFRGKIAGFFTACRMICGQIAELHFRMGVRPNVWTLLKLEYEALSHVEQYAVDLRWDIPELRRLLAERVAGYLKRAGTKHLTFLSNLSSHQPTRDERLIALAFESKMQWGSAEKLRPPHVPLSTLSRRRPRWMIELAKESARSAIEKHHPVIQLDDIISRLTAFGLRRIEDTVAEFKPQCQQIHELITAFQNQREDYRTPELIETINRRVLPGVPVHIEGVPTQPDARKVAAFLFYIGFLTARRDLLNDEYEHFTYSDKPDLLQSRPNIDQGMSWEIHPVFRQALGLRTKEGWEVKRRG